MLREAARTGVSWLVTHWRFLRKKGLAILTSSVRLYDRSKGVFANWATGTSLNFLAIAQRFNC
jgi:hypothetical protein